MAKIAIFSRTSTTQQDVEQQTNALILEAERIGYQRSKQIIIQYQESATKNDIESRKGIQDLMHTIEADPEVNCVLCWELTRIARRLDVMSELRNFLIQHKICWIILKPSYTELIDRTGNVTPMMSLMFGILSSFAESEMMIKKERFTRAKDAMRQRGQKFAGAVMFGYTKDDNKMCIPHPIYAPIIVDIYNHYINTEDSLYETYMYVAGKYPAVFPVLEYIKAQHKIRHLFETDIYAKGNWCYPPLVTEEMLDKVRAKMSKAQCKPRHQTKRELLCRGLIFCAECGKRMVGSGGNTKAYVCPTDKLHNCQIGFDIADWIMWEEVRPLVNINSAFSHNEKIIELKEEIKSKTVFKEHYITKIAELNKKIEKLLETYMSGYVEVEMFQNKTNEYKKEKDDCQHKLDKVNAEINALQSIVEETQKELLHPTTINVDSITDFEVKQSFCRKYIEKMIVKKVKDEYRTFEISFEYTMPLIAARCIYKYVFKNQNNKHVWRINEDGTEDLIY